MAEAADPVSPKVVSVHVPLGPTLKLPDKHHIFHADKEGIKGDPLMGEIAATVGFFVGFSGVALFGPTSKLLQCTMNLSISQVGILVAMPNLSGSLTRLPFAAWADQGGCRKPFLVLLLLTMLGMGVLFFLFLFTYTPATEAELSLDPDACGVMDPALFPLICILGLFVGCGIGTFSVGIPEVSLWHKKSEQGLSLAIFAGVGNLAPGFFILAIAAALKGVGPAWAYLIWFALLLVGTFIYFLIGQDAWYFQLLHHHVPKDEARVKAAAMGQELYPFGDLVGSLKLSASRWQTWILCWIYFCGFGGFLALASYLPVYSIQYLQFDGLVPAILAMVHVFVGSLMRVAAGWLSDKVGGPLVCLVGLLVVTLGCVCLIATAAADDISTIRAVGITGLQLASLGMGLINGGVFKLVPRAVPEAVGAAAGWVGSLGAMGGFVFPPIFGLAVDANPSQGYALGFFALLLQNLLCYPSLVVLWASIRKSEAEEAAAAKPSPAVKDVELPAITSDTAITINTNADNTCNSTDNAQTTTTTNNTTNTTNTATTNNNNTTNTNDSTTTNTTTAAANSANNNTATTNNNTTTAAAAAAANNNNNNNNTTPNNTTTTTTTANSNTTTTNDTATTTTNTNSDTTTTTNTESTRAITTTGDTTAVVVCVERDTQSSDVDTTLPL